MKWKKRAHVSQQVYFYGLYHKLRHIVSLPVRLRRLTTEWVNAYAYVRGVSVFCVIKLSWVSCFQVPSSENHKKVTILDLDLNNDWIDSNQSNANHILSFTSQQNWENRYDTSTPWTPQDSMSQILFKLKMQQPHFCWIVKRDSWASSVCVRI